MIHGTQKVWGMLEIEAWCLGASTSLHFTEVNVTYPTKNLSDVLGPKFQLPSMNVQHRIDIRSWFDPHLLRLLERR